MAPLENARTIHVSNIAGTTQKETIHDFFTFCGKIESISVTPASSETGAFQSATITFEKDTAASTALLLDHTVLDEHEIRVETTASLSDLAAQSEEHASEDIRQEDKPKTAILAEYLAHGYVIGDHVLRKGIALDKEHGLSQRFSSYLNNMDNRFNATHKARAMDTTYGVTEKANQGYNTLTRYFETALNTPTGQQVRSFYKQGEKQVMDIHNEAVRLKTLKQGQKPAAKDAGVVEKGPHCTCAGSDGVCQCKPGECTCEGCQKFAADAPVASTSGAPVTSEKV